MSKQPPITCNVLLSLDGPDGFHVEQTISQLTHGGRYYFGKTDIYDAEPIELATTGEYKMHISNNGVLGVLGERGAMLRFTRFVHPTESYLGSVLVRGAGWLFLAIGCISGVVSWKLNEQVS